MSSSDEEDLRVPESPSVNPQVDLSLLLEQTPQNASSKVFDLTTSDIDVDYDDSSEDDVEVEYVVSAPMKRVLPASIDPSKRPREESPVASYPTSGQEFTFSMAVTDTGKSIIEALWTGYSPSAGTIAVVNNFLRVYGASDQFK